jgi:hypothetical protein
VNLHEWRVRLIDLDKRGGRVLLDATVEMEGDHEVELLFRCSERCSVVPVSSAYRVPQQNVSLSDIQDSASSVFHRSVAPICSCASHAFDRRSFEEARNAG